MTESTPNGSNTDPRSSDPNSHFWQNLKGFLNDIARGLGKLVERGNRRQLILRNDKGQTLLRLSLTLAVLLMLAVAWLRLLPLLVIGVIVALVLKMQFVVATDVTKSE